MNCKLKTPYLAFHPGVSDPLHAPCSRVHAWCALTHQAPNSKPKLSLPLTLRLFSAGEGLALRATPRRSVSGVTTRLTTPPHRGEHTVREKSSYRRGCRRRAPYLWRRRTRRRRSRPTRAVGRAPDSATPIRRPSGGGGHSDPARGGVNNTAA